MFASCRGDDGQAAPKATGQAVRAAKKAVHARGGARIYASTRARNTPTRRATHTHTQRIHAHKHTLTAQARRKHVARTDGAQHVTKRRGRGQIRVLWSKSINDATAALPLKIRALQAAKRRKGATRTRNTRKEARRDVAKGRQAAEKGRERYDKATAQR